MHSHSTCPRNPLSYISKRNGSIFVRRLHVRPAAPHSSLTASRLFRRGCLSREAPHLVKGTVYIFTGTVKWFNTTKGYGFIQPDDQSKDIFVHISAVERANLTTLNEG